MKKVSVLCFFLFFFTGLMAQNLRVSGIVKEFTTRQAIKTVTIRLLEKDSVFLEGCITDDAGKFTLEKVPRGNSYIVVSYVGYKQEIIYLNNLTRNTRIDDIFLEEASENLGEVVVSAERVINKVNRQIIFPSRLQVDASASAFELLGKMMLPDLLVNVTENTISSLNNGTVQLRINNVNSSVQDVLAILSTQVVKVEYIDIPGARYGEGVASVVNFVTRRANNGVTGGMNLRNAATTGYGNDNFYLKYNNKASEFALNYNLTYRDFKDKYTDMDQRLLLKDGSIRALEKRGIDSPYKLQKHGLSLTYNWVNKETSVFNVKLSNSWMNTPFYNTIQSIKETGKEDLQAYTGIKDKSLSPVLDVYYQLDLPSDQTLMANVVGTYISTDYIRDYAEYLEGHTPFGPEYNYTVDGNKYSLIAELIYEKIVNENLQWSSGVNYKQSYTENTYKGSTGDVTTSMDNSDLYVYTELDGSIKKLGYNVGIGFSRQSFNETSHKYNYYSVRPTLSLSYPLLDKLFLRYSFRINPLLPPLTRLSDVDQWQNEYEVIVGNPALKPYRAYINSLTLRYSTDRFLIQAMGYYQYNRKPILSTNVVRVDEGDDYYFQYGYANQKSFTHLQGQLYLQVDLIKDVLNLSLYGGINRYINRGNEYVHTYTAPFGGAELEAMYKNWTLSASVDSELRSEFAETIRRSPAGADVTLSYRPKKNLKFGIGVMNPFFKNGEKGGEELLSSLAPKETWNYTKDLGNMVYLSCSWSFSIGRKHQAKGSELYNSDTESGVVK